ncbi:MAG TPA: DUF4159 domain-containing protein [Steroidobacteraceae bacterium]|jgi:hypothetical protein|nr:DUF4159 domain-containing protein [Steroidobacteraceae bacterium]
MSPRGVHETLLARLALTALLTLAPAIAAAQREFRVYPSFEGADADAPLPPDWQVPGEVVIGRLMYPNGAFSFFGGDWRQGGTSWTDDYPRGDRTLVQMLRRFTRMNVRAVEQPVNLDDGDDVDYWPFLLVGLAQAWQLTDSQAANLREYLLRGGFMFCDSFFGSSNWTGFEESLRRVFPDRPILDLKDDHPIFHTVFDLPHMTRVQIPNMNSLMAGGSGYLSDGRVPRWRGIEDDTGRLMVLIAFNNDVADAWQWADDPRYPAREANLALRLGVNVVMYALTH